MSYGRTGLVLRQWVVRDGCIVTAYQAEAYETHAEITSVTDKLKVFVFENEWRAKLCERRMNYCKYEDRKRVWLKYFHNHVNPPPPHTSRDWSLWYLVIGVLVLAYLLNAWGHGS